MTWQARPVQPSGGPEETAATGDVIHLLFCADPSYFQHLAVAACSVASSNRRVALTIHLLTRQRDAAQERRLAESLAPFRNVSYTIYLVDDDRVSRAHVHSHYAPEVYLRLLAPEILPAGLERVLYLDSDLIVLDDLLPLWRTDLRGHAVGAAPDFPWDPLGTEIQRHTALGIVPGSVYVNTGVLLMDLVRWRRADLSARLFDYIAKRGPELLFVDQDALNAVLHGDIKVLDPRWNLQARMYRLGRRRTDEVRAACRQPAILHYSTWDKPWNFRSTAARRSDYFRYLRLTSWRDADPPASLGRLQQLEHRSDRLLTDLGIDMRVVSAQARRVAAALAAPFKLTAAMKVTLDR